jgi:hypothetical protein
MADQPISADGRVEVTLELPVAYRRWTGIYMTSKTSDLVVVAFVPPAGTSRYASFPLSVDWNTGLLRPGRRMKIAMDTPWEALCSDSHSLLEVQ